MAYVPFEQMLSPIVFEEIEECSEIKKQKEYRVVPKNIKELFDAGIDTEKLQAKRVDAYTGDKWGGKYLRAPDIYYTILEKGKDKLVRLGDIAEVRFGIKTGANEFFYLTQERIDEWGIEEEFLKPVIKSPRECKTIQIDPSQLKYKIFMCHKSKRELNGTNALRYIEWGEEQIFSNNPSVVNRKYWYSCPQDLYGNIFWTKETNDRIGCFVSNKMMIADCRLYFADANISFQNSVNSTLQALFSEILCRSGLGLGARSLMVYEVNDFIMLNPIFVPNNELAFSKRELFSIYNECGLQKNKHLKSQEPNPIPDRKALDDIVFDAIGLTQDERNEVYWAVCELVQRRLAKAGSV
jgi:hypothetical protein